MGSWSLPCSTATRRGSSLGPEPGYLLSEDEMDTTAADLGPSVSSRAEEPRVPTRLYGEQSGRPEECQESGQRPESLPVPQPAWRQGPPPPAQPCGGARGLPSPHSTSCHTGASEKAARPQGGTLLGTLTLGPPPHPLAARTGSGWLGDSRTLSESIYVSGCRARSVTAK